MIVRILEMGSAFSFTDRDECEVFFERDASFVGLFGDIVAVATPI